MTSAENRDWKEICEAATRELDSEKLIALIAELVKALDGRKTPSRQVSDC
jgi:hypothetical protein